MTASVELLSIGRISASPFFLKMLSIQKRYLKGQSLNKRFCDIGAEQEDDLAITSDNTTYRMLSI
jgi:hypothetical protein